jgi:dipeptidyl aminopeptidase/acylaminoacyl peptidase
MFLNKLKTAAAALLAAHLIALAAGLLVYQALAAGPPPDVKKEDAPKPAADAPKGPLARERATLTGHGGMVWAVVVSPDGKSLASVSGLYNKPGELVIWDAATGKERARVQKPKGIRSVAWAPDGKTLATADYYDNTVRLRDPDTGAERLVLKVNDANNAVAFSPDSKVLAVGLLAGKAIKLYDVATGKELRTLVGHTDWVPHVAFAPDGRTLASGGRDQTARLWDPDTGKELATLQGHSGIVEMVAFSPDGRTLATASWDQTVKLWEVASGKERGTLAGHKVPVLSVAWSPDGRMLASTGGESNSPIAETNEQPGEVKLWDARALREVAGFQGHKFRVWCAAFGPDGKTLATSSDDQTVKLWDLSRGPEPVAQEPTAKELEGLWADLAGEDAARAYQAVGKLALAPKQAVPFLRGRLKAEQPADAEQQKRVAQLVADLDSNSFSTREKATEELEKLGPAAEPALKKALEGEPSVELRRRAERLLEKVRGPVASPELLRALRAVEALEYAGTSEAREALAALAKGTPEARITREAKAAAGRLGRRDGGP